MIIERSDGRRFAVRIFLGRDENGRQRFKWVGTYSTREAAEEAERVARPPRPRRCAKCQRQFAPENDRRVRCDICLRKAGALELSNDDHWVYYCYDELGALLYVGVTSAGVKRFRQHGNKRSWWGQIAVVNVKHFTTADEARDYERAEIARLLPPHNSRLKGKRDQETSQ